MEWKRRSSCAFQAFKVVKMVENNEVVVVNINYLCIKSIWRGENREVNVVRVRDKMWVY